MKTFIYLLLAILLLGTMSCVEHETNTISRVSRYRDGRCFFKAGGIEFEADCNKFQVGDTVVICKK